MSVHFAYAVGMPDSYGKRQRREINAKKAVAREERRVARSQRRKDREAGLIEAGVPIAPSEDPFAGIQPASREPESTEDAEAGQTG
jgi:hypothetical protein